MAIIETKPAAYKGVGFLMITSRIAGGRKDVLFEFPNSNRQTVEDLGLRPRAYSMTAIIPHDDYFVTRDNLLRALEDGMRGPLEHPFYGRVENIVVRDFTVNERITDLGRAELQITFALSDNIGIPQKAENAISEANAANNALGDSIASDATDGFEVDVNEVGNFQDAKDLLNGVVDAYETVQSAAVAVTTQINQYAAQVNAFSTGINQLIATPQNLINSIRNIFSTMNGLYGSVDATFDAFTNGSLFDFGGNDSQIIQSTSTRVQRAQNRNMINQTIQTISLGYAYLNAAQIDFQTTDDIDAVNKILEDQYNKITSATGVAVDGIATPIETISGISDGSLTAITDLRTIANQLLDEKRIEARKVITVFTRKMPMSVIAYQYYEDTTLTDTLLELNAIKGASFVEGNIKILTE